jgi:hypothetical protein
MDFDEDDDSLVNPVAALQHKDEALDNRKDWKLDTSFLDSSIGSEPRPRPRQGVDDVVHAKVAFRIVCRRQGHNKNVILMSQIATTGTTIAFVVFLFLGSII